MVSRQKRGFQEWGRDTIHRANMHRKEGILGIKKEHHRNFEGDALIFCFDFLFYR